MASGLWRWEFVTAALDSGLETQHPGSHNSLLRNLWFCSPAFNNVKQISVCLIYNSLIFQAKVHILPRNLYFVGGSPSPSFLPLYLNVTLPFVYLTCSISECPKWFFTSPWGLLSVSFLVCLCWVHQTLLLLTADPLVNSVVWRSACDLKTCHNSGPNRLSFEQSNGCLSHPRPPHGPADWLYVKHVASMHLLLTRATHMHARTRAHTHMHAHTSTHTRAHLMASGHSLDLQRANNTHTYRMPNASNKYKHLRVHCTPERGRTCLVTSVSQEKPCSVSL